MNGLGFLEFLKKNDMLEEVLDEALHVKYVIRKGKPKKKWVSDRDGYKIQYDKNGVPHEKRISGVERRHRKLGQRTGTVKRAGIMGKIKLRKKFSNYASKKIGFNKASRTHGEDKSKKYLDKRYPILDNDVKVKDLEAKNAGIS